MNKTILQPERPARPMGDHTIAIAVDRDKNVVRVEFPNADFGVQLSPDQAISVGKSIWKKGKKLLRG